MTRLTGAERNKLVAGRKRITTTGDYKHGRRRVVKGKTQYWNANTGRWQSNKPGPKIAKSDYKSTTQKENTPTRAEKLKSGMATFRENTGAQKVLNEKLKAKEGGASNYVTTPSPGWSVKNKDGGGNSNKTLGNETEQQFLERTKNSPAAKAGLSDKQRWAARQKYLEFKKRDKTSKEARKKRRDDRLKKRIKNSLKINKR